MPYDHQLYLANCKKMIRENQIQVEKTKRVLNRTKNPIRIAELKLELQGWEEWVERWKQRLADAENISKEK